MFNDVLDKKQAFFDYKEKKSQNSYFSKEE